MLVKTCLFVALFYLVNGNIWAKGDFSTPRTAAESILKAALNADVETLAANTSTPDRKALLYLKNTRGYSSAVEDRKNLETRYKIAVKGSIDDYMLAKMLLELCAPLNSPEQAADRDLFLHYVILDEHIWNDKYAEVRLMVPYSGKGAVPPVVFPFLKENGEWKFAQWLAPAIFLGTYDAKGGLDRLVSLQLKTHALIDLNRSDCSKMTQHEWPVPKAIDEYYQNLIAKAKGSEKRKYFEFWVLTTSSKAMKAAESAPEMADFVKNYIKYSGKAPAPCNGSDKITDSEIKNITPEVWFKIAQLDILGLKNLISAFPKEREWIAKTELQIGERYFFEGDMAASAAKYKKVISDYSDTSVYNNAKIKLADLDWSYLRNHSEALALWQDLEKAGKLPPGTPYAKGFRIAPQLVYEEKEDGVWFTWPVDFIPQADGKLLLLSQRADKDKKQIATVDLINRAGKTSRLLTIPTNDIKGIKSSGDGWLIYGSMRGFLVDKAWQPKTVLLPQRGNRMLAAPYANASETPGSAIVFAWDINANDFLVWGEEGFGSFSYNGKQKASFPLPPNCTKDDYMSLAHNKFGSTMYASGAGTCTGFFTGASGFHEFKDPVTNEGRYNSLGDFAIDQQGNLVAYSQDFESGANAKKLMKFSPDSSLIGEYLVDDNKDYLGKLAALKDGRTLIYTFTPKKSPVISVIGKDLQLENTINLVSLNIPPNTPGCAGLAAEGNLIYAAIGSKLYVFNYEGELKKEMDIKPGLARFSRAKDKLYLCNDSQLYLVSGTDVKKMADLPPKSFFTYTSGNAGLLYVYGEGFYRYDPASQKKELVTFKSSLDFSRMPPNWEPLPDGRIAAYISAISAIGIYFLNPETGAVMPMPIKGPLRRKWRISGIQTDGEGNFYLSDEGNVSIMRLDKNGKFAGLFDIRQLTFGALPKVKVDEAGNIYFISMTGRNDDSHRIYKLDAKGINWTY